MPNDGPSRLHVDLDELPQSVKDSIRSARQIKAGLLRRAFDGESRYSSTEMIRMIGDASRRSNTLSDEHRMALQAINPSQARGVRALNMLAEHLGLPERYIDNSSTTLVPGTLTVQ